VLIGAGFFFELELFEGLFLWASLFLGKLGFIEVTSLVVFEVFSF
jgi:hypothetical protein